MNLVFETLKVTTLALRVVLGHIEAPYMQTARSIMRDVIMDENYRKLSPAERAAIADAGSAIDEAAAVAKGLKR